MIWKVLGRLIVAVIAVATVLTFCLAIASPLILANWDNHKLLAESAVQFLGIFVVGWLMGWIVRWEQAR